VAAEVKRATGLDADLKVGNSGELSVWLDGKLVAQKQGGMFPTPESVVAELEKLLAT
jgi:hypothetical protein